MKLRELSGRQEREPAADRVSRADEAQAMRASVEEELRAVGPGARMVDALRAGIPDDGILVCDTTTVASGNTSPQTRIDATSFG